MPLTSKKSGFINNFKRQSLRKNTTQSSTHTYLPLHIHFTCTSYPSPHTRTTDPSIHIHRIHTHVSQYHDTHIYTQTNTHNPPNTTKLPHHHANSIQVFGSVEEGGKLLKECFMPVGYPDVRHVGAGHVVACNTLLCVVWPQPELLHLVQLSLSIKIILKF